MDSGLKRLLSPICGDRKRSKLPTVEVPKALVHEGFTDQKRLGARGQGLNLSEARDLVLRIFGFFVSPSAVDVKSLEAIGQTCRTWRELRRSPYLWRGSSLVLSDGRLNRAILEKIKRHHDGTEGQCFKCRLRSTGEILAVRRPRVYFEEDDGEGIPYYMMRELAVLRSLQHEHIAAPVFIHLRGHRLYIFFPFEEYNLMELTAAIAQKNHGTKSRTRRRIPEEDAKQIFKQLLLALSHCHGLGVMHRNVKPNHILVTPGPDPERPYTGARVKLADFALTRLSSVPLRPYTPSLMTLWYKPPELLLGQELYTTAVDMWSAGCVFSQMLTGIVAFPGVSEVDQLFRIFFILGTPTAETWPNFPTLPHNDITFPKWETRRLWKLFEMVNMQIARRALSPVDANRISDSSTSSEKVTGQQEDDTSSVSEGAIRFLDRLLCYHDAQRLTAAEALASDYIDHPSGLELSVLKGVGWDGGNQLHRFYDSLLRYEESVCTKQQAVPDDLMKSEDRALIANWIVDVVDSFDMAVRGAFLCMAYFDAYLAAKPGTEKSKWQLIAATCLHIASKCEDVQYIGIKDLITASGTHFTWNELLEVENEVLRALDFKLAVPLILDFVQLIMSILPEASPKLRQMALYLAEASFTVPQIAAARPSKVASCIAVISHYYCGVNDWTPEIKRAIYHPPEELFGIASRIHLEVCRVPQPYFTTVRERYSRSDHGNVATTSLPTHLVLRWVADPVNGP